MRLCVISTSIFKTPVVGYSGLEHLAWLTARGLAEKGHEVSLIAPEGSTCPNVEIIVSGPVGMWDEKNSYSTYWKRLPDFDCIIDNSWNKWSYILKGEGILKAPVLGVMHAPVNTMYQSLPPNVEKPCFVCISQDQANHFNALFSPKEARVCYNGIDLNFYKPLDIPRTNRFLFLARFSTIKGPHLAIEACLKAGVGLDLIGDTSITQEPEYLERCKRLAEQQSPGWDSTKGKQIRIVGSCSRGETVWWYSQALCLLHPNQRFREPFGLAPVEAMACGCPVIAWNYGAMSETVKDSRTGRLIKSFDDLVTSIGYCSFPDPVYDYQRCADSWRTNCRGWALQFSIERMVSRYEELAQEAVKTGGW